MRASALPQREKRPRRAEEVSLSLYLFVCIYLYCFTCVFLFLCLFPIFALFASIVHFPCICVGLLRNFVNPFFVSYTLYIRDAIIIMLKIPHGVPALPAPLQRCLPRHVRQAIGSVISTSTGTPTKKSGERPVWSEAWLI